jgi:hypothetical protein
VVGPNGSGKSTLLRCVAGMDRPSAGPIRLCGRPMRERDPDTRRSVAAVLDDMEFFADLAVAEHLALLMSAHGDAAPDEHAASLLGEAGLASAADQLPAGLSSGGSGTTHRAVLAGVPSMAVPIGFDQPYWGRRLAELGVGVPPIPYRKLSPARLASAIRQLTGDPEIVARAKQLGAVLSAENGPSAAAQIIMTAFAA